MRALLFLALISIVSCTSPTGKDTENEPKIENVSVEPKAIAGGEQCYLFIAVKDTYALKLNIIDNTVKGTAVYKNYEKDSSHGAVEGEVDGDIIHLWYSFQSEGMNSVRELYFKKNGDQLTTGIAEEQVKGDSAYVPDKNSVKYSGPVYAEGDCNSVPVLK
ncbi:hypothetical protein [Niabella ginsengisoli]|uniref:Lipoprotein n=1 Tax=Niabella ginsengisoli TaxID=522298 RepID=A0ABS9SDR6_9BACT|nr:hypothetical protein [Niabella ginsengisoli]MCH5596500.1 hypothetical protein [Niabella ginsengisoli]